MYAVGAVIACIVIGFVYSWQVAIVGTGMMGLLGFALIGLAFYITFMNEDTAKNDEAGKVLLESDFVKPILTIPDFH